MGIFIGYTHPKLSLKNANEICDLSKKEKNIILRHMWPLTLCPPRYREGYIVTFVDKYLATREIVIYIKKRKSKK